MSQPRAALAALAAYSALAVGMTHPLWLRLSDSLPGDVGDPLLNTWILAWDAHALMSRPGGLFDANIFFPRPNTLAYSEHLLSTALLAVPIQALTGEPLIAYNLSFLASFALMGLAVFLLVRRVTGSAAAAFLAGVAAAFGPYRFAMASHLQLLTLAWLPLALLCLDRFMVRRRGADLAAGTLFLLLQAASSWHLAAFAAVAVAIWIGVRAVWLGWEKVAPTLAPLGAAAVALVAAMVPLAIPYLETKAEMSSLRPLDMRMELSARPEDLLSASRDNRVFGDMAWSQEAVIEEKQLFPGIIAPLSLLLLATGVATGRLRPRRRAGAAVWAMWTLLGISCVMALGPVARAPGGGWVGLPHGWLEAAIPPLELIRAPARWAIPASFAAASLLGIFIGEVLRRLPAGGWRRPAATFGVALLLVVEGLSAPFPLAFVGSTDALSGGYGWIAESPEVAAVVELPVHVAPEPEYPEAVRMYASAVHWKGLANGYSGMTPQSHQRLGEALATFPSDQAIQALHELRRQGVTHAIVHPQEGSLAEAWEEWRWRISAGLDLTLVGDWDDALVYEIGPHGGRDVATPEGATSIQAGFDGRIELVAYDADRLANRGPRLTLYWRRIGEVEEDYTIFVHLLDSQGRVIAQADGPPASGYLPTSAWPEGRIVRDERLLEDEMASDTTEIAVGLYLPSTMERLEVKPVGDGPADDALRLPWPGAQGSR